jgi:hypothetical protein
MGVEMRDGSGTMVAEKAVELSQRFREVSIAAPINDVEPLSGVRVIETKPIFGHGRGSDFRSSPKRRDKQKHDQQ